MNAVELLLRDHEEVKKLFRQFEEAGKRAYKKKQGIAEQVIQKITVHSQLEERIFYPAVRAKAGQETGDMILEGIEEHRVADFMMERLKQTEPTDETYDAKFKVLVEGVEHHVKEEEGQVFPEAKKAVGDDLESLGAQMEKLEQQLAK